MDSHPRIPANARNSREIEGFTVLGKYDGAAVEGKAHAFQVSERRAKRLVRTRLSCFVALGNRVAFRDSSSIELGESI